VGADRARQLQQDGLSAAANPSTALNPKAFGSLLARKVRVCGIPHLAKNERDVGHPEFVANKLGILGTVEAVP
jgi:hypothetical protein